MLQNKVRIISKRKAKRDLSTIGLCLIVYVLFVLIFPYGFKTFMDIYDPKFTSDEYFYIGVYLLIVVLGTFIPFFILKQISGVKSNRLFGKVNASFIDLFVQTIVCIATCTALTYVSNILLSYINVESRLLSGIGLNYGEAYLDNYLYIFLLIIVTPILEEFAFRGVLINALGKYGKVFALYTSALIFAFAHSTVGEILPGFAMGYVLGKISLRYKSIQPTIFIHILFNAFIYSLVVMPEKYATYMAYGIGAICILAFYLFITGRYRTVKMKKSRGTKTSFSLFFKCFTIIFSIVLMIIHLLLVAFFDVIQII